MKIEDILKTPKMIKLLAENKRICDSLRKQAQRALGDVKEGSMKITTETKLWIVTDPTPESVLPDICWPATLANLENQIIGALPERMTDKNMTIYTDMEEAQNDADARLNACV